MNPGNILRYLKTFYSAALKPDRPHIDSLVHMQIEPTTFCNLDCRSCSRKYAYSSFAHMPLARFTQILDTLKPMHLMLSGLGEPLLSPDIDAMVSEAKKRKIRVNLTTNGILLKDHAEALVKCGLDLLSISIDAATAETYIEVRGNDGFGKIKEGITAVTEARKKFGRAVPKIRTHFVIQKENIRELSDFVRFSKSSGADTVYFQPLDIKALPDERSKPLTEGLSFDIFIAGLREALKTAAGLKIKTNLAYIISYSNNFWKLYSKQDIGSVNCILPWISTYITVDGTVRPCCSFVFSGTANDLGNAFKEDFKTVWESDKYASFRKTLKNNSALPPTCGKCVTKNLSYALNFKKIAPGFGEMK